MTLSRSGESLTRVEDDHLLRGASTFVANLPLTNATTAHFVTSTMAHARILSVDVSDAAVAPGVLAVVVAADLESAGLGAVLPGLGPEFPPDASWQILASDRVLYVGQPIVAIVAENESAATDAAELVVVEYEPLDAVIDLASVEEAQPLFSTPSNVMHTESLEGADPIDFSQFEAVVDTTINSNRVAPCPMETRVAAAEWDEAGRLTQYAACQGVHPIRNGLAAYYGMDRADIRVITADVGGSFGAKARLYPEDILLGHLSRLVGRPVLWSPTRSADMVGLGHSRSQLQHITIAGDRSGKIRALQATVRGDCGAFPASGLALARNTGRMLPGPYDIEQVYWTLEAAVTNTTPLVAYRGAGRPEAGALVDRAVDLFAAEVGLDPLEVRRMNLIQPEQIPYANPGGVTYDSGDYGDALDRLLDELDLPTVRAQQATERDTGSTTLTGVGFSIFVDRTAGVPGTEYGSLQLKADGTFRVLTGSSPYGQGHYTTWIQLVSERTGASVESIEVMHGDTDLVPRGGITGGSRSAQKAGSAVTIATDALVDEARAKAADLLEAAVGDVVLDIDSAQFHVAGAPAAASVGWAEIAVAMTDEDHDPDDGEIVHACEADYDTDAPSVPYGAYAAVVEVDAETGEVVLQRIVSIDDAGTVINPMIVLGQVHGGIGQAIGQALWEEFVYDADGNPLTSTFMDYGIPSAAEMPSFESSYTEHPSPHNPLGAKGIAESGTIGGVPAIQNAVIDAVAHLGVRHIDLPVTPQRVWQAIHSA